MDVDAERIQVFSTLLRSTSALLSVDDEPAMLAHFCSTLTRELPRIALAWTWFGPADTQEIVPQVRAGSAQAYADGLRIARNPQTEDGPAFRALTGMRALPFRVSPDSGFDPWREAAVTHGIREVLALPLRSLVDDQRGIFVLYATEEGFFNHLGLAIFEALGELFSAVLSRAARQVALQRAATQDPLTGLYSRECLPLLCDRLARADDAAAPAAVLRLDLDLLRPLSELHGQGVADAVIQQVAILLQATVRGDALLVRWGGEAFLIGLRGAESRAAVAVADRLRRLLAEQAHLLPSGGELRVSASVGVALVQPGEPLPASIERAESALTSARRSGRNRTVLA